MSSHVSAFVVSLFCLLPLSVVPLLFLSLLFVLCLGHHPPCDRERRALNPMRTQNEEYCLVAIHNPLTGYEPKQFDNFDYSETSAVIFQDESVDIDTEPSCS